MKVSWQSVKAFSSYGPETKNPRWPPRRPFWIRRRPKSIATFLLTPWLICESFVTIRQSVLELWSGNENNGRKRRRRRKRKKEKEEKEEKKFWQTHKGISARRPKCLLFISTPSGTPIWKYLCLTNGNFHIEYLFNALSKLSQPPSPQVVNSLPIGPINRP